MKRLYIWLGSIGSVVVTLVLWATFVGAASGDVMYILHKLDPVKLVAGQKTKLKTAILATFTGTTANSIDEVKCDSSFTNQEIDSGSDNEDGSPIMTQVEVLVQDCEAFDEKTITDDEFVKKAIAGELRTGHTGTQVVSLGKVRIVVGSDMHAKWNLFTQSASGYDIDKLITMKVWRSKASDPTVVSMQGVPFKVASPAIFRADWEAGKVVKALKVVQ